MWLYSTTSTRLRAVMLIGTHVLGDSGYTLYPWLMTPFLENDVGRRLNEDHRRYNKLHSSTKMAVECSFGKWKGEFRRLQTVMDEKTIEKTCRIIAATAALYNLFEDMKDDTAIDRCSEIQGYDEEDLVAESETTRDIAKAERNIIM